MSDDNFKIATEIVDSFTFQVNDRHGSIWYCSFLIIGDYRLTLETESYKIDNDEEKDTKFVWYRTFDQVLKEEPIRLYVAKETGEPINHLFQDEEITKKEKFVKLFNDDISCELGASTIIDVSKETTIDIVAHLLRIKKFRVMV